MKKGDNVKCLPIKDDYCMPLKYNEKWYFSSFINKKYEVLLQFFYSKRSKIELHTITGRYPVDLSNLSVFR